MRLHPSILCLLALLPVSCASNSTDAKPDPRKPLMERVLDNGGYKQDSEGNWKAQSDKRSPYENLGESAYFQGDVGKKNYQTNELGKRSWWGNKNYGNKKYAGATDGSRFQKSSRLDGQGAPEAGKSSGMSNTYRTGDYATGKARETGSRNIEKPSDSVTDNRRQEYQAPEIIDWREQRSLSLEQSKGILGR